MPATPSGARSTIAAPPASPSVSDANSRLRMLRTWAAGVATQPGDALSAHHHPAAYRAAADPVVENEDACEHARARIREVEGESRAEHRSPGRRTCALRRLVLRHHVVAVLRDAAVDDDVQIGAEYVECCEAVPRGVHRQASSEFSPSPATRRSWIPVSRSRSMCVWCRVDAITSSDVTRCSGSFLPMLSKRETNGARLVAGRRLHHHPSVVHRHPQLLTVPSAQSFSVSTYKSSSARAGRPSERHDHADDAVLDLGRRERAPQGERLRVVADEIAGAGPPRRERGADRLGAAAPDRP